MIPVLPDETGLNRRIEVCIVYIHGNSYVHELSDEQHRLCVERGDPQLQELLSLALGGNAGCVLVNRPGIRQ
jgi:hypothetical protein